MFLRSKQQQALYVLFLVGIFSSAAIAENRLTIESGSFPASSGPHTVALQANHDSDLYGFSFGVSYDSSIITVTDVTWSGALTQGPDFFMGGVDDTQGVLGYGCVLDFAQDGGGFDGVLQGPNVEVPLALITFDVIASSGSTQLTLTDSPVPNPLRPIKNVFTNDQGLTEVPALTDGTISVADPGVGWLPGNTNGDEMVDISDMINILGHLFGGGTSIPECLRDNSTGQLTAAGEEIFNWNGDFNSATQSGVDISDVIGGLSSLFAAGPAHVLGEACYFLEGSTCVGGLGCE
ncbi:MAG: cohesin domain-containing protein [Planctomycetes bacterium]|nr:cohesin domain-containing protein [Planctomycetota bacterium]